MAEVTMQVLHDLIKRGIGTVLERIESLRGDLNRSSGTFALYKGKGCAKFSQLPPRFGDKGFITKNGGILVEVAPGVGTRENPEWDWNQKITFAIGVADICNLLSVNPKDRRLYHDHGGTPKVLEFIPSDSTDPKYKGTYMMQVSEGKGDDRKAISVPVSSGEWQVLMRLLLNSTSSMLNWK